MARTEQVAVAMSLEEKLRIESAASNHNISPSRLLYMILVKATEDFSFFTIDFRDNEHSVPDNVQQPA